jgi:hypothetical protein
VTTDEPAFTLLIVSVSSELFVSAVSSVPDALSQSSGASSAVSPEPPSRKRTWMSASGGLWSPWQRGALYT